jgi:pectate lyase
VDGQISELDSAALAVVPGAWRTLRLEAVGDHLRAYVDGALLLEARDATHPSGASGIVTWRTVGRFDYLRIIQP